MKSHDDEKIQHGFGECLERTLMLHVLLEELEIHQFLLEGVYREFGQPPKSLDGVKRERETLSQIKSRESMIRVLALKSTDFVT